MNFKRCLRLIPGRKEDTSYHTHGLFVLLEESREELSNKQPTYCWVTLVWEWGVTRISDLWVINISIGQWAMGKLPFGHGLDKPKNLWALLKYSIKEIVWQSSIGPLTLNWTLLMVQMTTIVVDFDFRLL